MQKTFIQQSLAGLLISSAFLYSCTGSGGQQFSTKEDSVRFAQAVMEKYPGEKRGVSLLADTVPVPKGRDLQEPKPTGMQPISWETVIQYSESYDKDPQLKSPYGYYYKGFIIDTAGYNMLLRNAAIKGLFLRLGKKADGSYTVMLLGLNEKGGMVYSGDVNAKGGVALKDSSNYDNLNTCPEICP